jgi:hypothetical protein
MDVYGYAAANPEFPHQSTVDQWFDETQFESYRRLGIAVGLQGAQSTDHGNEDCSV